MRSFWTKREYELLDKVNSFEEMADVAISVLLRMRETDRDREIVQICGPTSTGGFGNRADNMARFQLAIDRATNNGLTVFDQIPCQRAIIRICRFKDNGLYNWDILEVFYRKIFESGHVQKTLFLKQKVQVVLLG